MSIQYKPFEMHCHTLHSDGSFTVEELLNAAAASGYEGICLTDHNTMSGLREVAQLQKPSPFVMSGIEWTTFFGHLLVLGGSHFTDWRFVTPDSIDKALEEIQSKGSVAGIAHPFEMGAPLSCGSNWEFHVTRWDLLQYIEVWSNASPHTRLKNKRALPFYDGLLQAGYHLAATAGRDWHRPDKQANPIVAATYLGLEDGILSEACVTEALRYGRTYISLGPTLSWSVIQDGHSFGIGDTVASGRAEIHAVCTPEVQEKSWSVNGLTAQELRLVENGAVIAAEQPAEGSWNAVVDLQPGWLRLETVVLLSKGEVDSKKIRVEFSLEDMDMSEFQDGATYPQIKEYVLEHTGLKISSLYISQVKKKCGLEVGKNYNLPKSEDARQAPTCPPEKENAIREALQYFGMI